VFKFYSYSPLYFILGLLLLVSNSFAQSERKAWNRLQDGKWESAHRLLRKSLQKDRANPEANYILANWFFMPANPDFQIDSAYQYINTSIRYYDTLSVRDKDRVHKFPIDSLILHNLKAAIDSAAFVRAKQLNTELSYLLFIKSFPTSVQVINAIELRDEVSFLEALKVNTYQSFQSYLARYPGSHRAKEATERYEKLLFEEKTKSRKLASYRSFLKEYPASPYADEAQQQVFEIATASGEPEVFFNYQNEYPATRHAKLVNEILFHLYKDREEMIPESVLTDSLKHVIELEAKFWFPFLRNGLFGFMDETGAELLTPQFQEVREEYKCRPVAADILALPDGYFSRSGKKLANHAALIDPIGAGFLKVDDQTCVKLIHKSGRIIINDCFEDYEMVDDNFIAALRDNYYILYTLAGRPLPITGITKVAYAEGLILMTRSGKKVINTIDQLAALADGQPFHDELVFDEVIPVEKNMLLVRNSGMEGLLDARLNYVVPLDLHTLTKTSFGFVEKHNGRVTVHGLSDELENKSYDNITFYRNWLVLFQADKKQLYDIPSRRLIESDADSIWFDRSLAFIDKGSLRKAYLSAKQAIDLQPDSKINFVASRDSVQFFFTENKKNRTVFHLNKGEPLFSTDFNIEESLGQDYFIVSKGARKGVLNKNGKVIVPVEMESIIISDKQHLSLLKNKKFGLFDLLSGKYFKPVYERNLIPMNTKNLIVYKDGFYGLIDQQARPVTAFEFTEVLPWGDSLIWVKKDFQWRLVNYYTQKVLLDKVKAFNWLKNNEEEKIIRINRENYFGVVSNKRGTIIAPTFTDIINLGDADHPFYFTEKQVEEAGIFVVVYFDQTGKLVRKHAYEEEEYDRILCVSH
jgi:hypothetical protein